MNSYLINAARFNASTTANSTIIAKTGIITAFRPWVIDVTFYPNTSEDGYDAGAVEVPLQSSWVGNGWGLYCAPSLGTEVTVLFENGNLQLPIGLGFIFSGDVQPIQDVQSEECWLVHKSGSAIKLTNDGKVSINGHAEVDINTTGAVNVTASTIVSITAQQAINLQAPVVNVSQDLVIANNLSANNGETTMEDGVFNATSIHATGDVTAGSVSLATHTHGGVQTGGGNTSPPNT